MGICAKVVQVNGEDLLALDPSQTNLTSCVYVVESGSDLANDFFRMSAQDGAVFSAGLISCWFTAWVCRLIVSIIKDSTNE